MNKAKSLYIHIPFCENLCDYCDFPKLQYFRNFAIKYLEKLKEEIDSYQIGKLDTIYVGGGTPTSLDDDLFEELLKIILPYTNEVKEYTFEANPESLNENKISLMKKYGVNRLSIGVESTDDNILKAINRHHTFLDVVNAISLAKKVGFNNINVDLILGLPHALKRELIKDLDRLTALPITHISCYSLTIHPHTVFYLKGIKEQTSDIERELYDLVNDYLSKKDFIHYEVSNWAKKGYSSLHNMTYWKDEHYYGVGLGAAGYIDNIRYTNTKSINDYLNGITVIEKEIVDQKADKEYYLMLNLRTNEGINLASYQQKFNEDLLQKKNKEITDLINRGLLIYNKDNNISCTYEGLMLLDEVILELLDEDN